MRQERANESDRRMERLEQRENMAEKAEEVTKMAVTVFHCQEVGCSLTKERVPLFFTRGLFRMNSIATSITSEEACT